MLKSTKGNPRHIEPLRYTVKEGDHIAQGALMVGMAIGALLSWFFTWAYLT